MCRELDEDGRGDYGEKASRLIIGPEACSEVYDNDVDSWCHYRREEERQPVGDDVGHDIIQVVFSLAVKDDEVGAEFIDPKYLLEVEDCRDELEGHVLERLNACRGVWKLRVRNTDDHSQYEALSKQANKLRNIAIDILVCTSRQNSRLQPETRSLLIFMLS